MLAGALSGCVTTAVMEKSAAINDLPSVAVSVDGKFGGFGSDGTFKIADMYHGQFSRDASNSKWFGISGTKQSGLVALIQKEGTEQSWKLACHGEQSNLTLGGLNMSGSEPFSCDIYSGDKKVGLYTIKAEHSLMGTSKETGSIQIQGTSLQLAAVKRAQGAAFDTSTPLGYSFKLNGQEVAATETNAHVSIQMMESLTADQKDAVVVGSIASALSWRPENNDDL